MCNPLGRPNNKSFFGNAPACFANYLKFCRAQKPKPDESEIILTADVFHRERKARGVYLEKAYVIVNAYELY